MPNIVTHLGQDFPWIAYKNGHNNLSISFLNNSATFDISSYTFVLNIRKVRNSENVLQLTQGSGVTNGGVTGILTIDLTHTQASTTLPGDYYFYEIIYTVNSKTYAFIQGGLTLSSDSNPGTTTTSLSITTVNLGGTEISAEVTLVGNTHFRGLYVSLAALQSAVPVGNSGDYADVDSGVGNDVQRYIWDAQAGWVVQGASSAATWGAISGTLTNQTDLNSALASKAPTDSPTFTGTVSGITKSMVGLSNVDNTSDASKPISTATQTALDLKADAANVIYLPNITGYLGATGSDGSITAATAVDRIPTTSISVGRRISAIVTISGTQRRLYAAELVTPADATANIELSPSVIRPNDFNSTTNNKVWREIKNSGIIDVSNYGVVPDASVTVSDQINAIIAAASSGDTLIFPPSGSSSYKCFGITANKKLHFVGFGAKIQWQGLSANMFNISVDGTTVRGFEFVGQGRNNATYPAQGCIRISSCSNILIQDCLFDSMPSFCIQTNTTHISDTSSDFGGINIVNCHMMRSGYGFYADTRGEYTQLVGCSIVDCNTGAYIGAGNINFTGSQILDCSTVAINMVTGTNDAHGVFSGCQINHNTKALTATGIVNGHFFRGCNIYFGDIEITNSTGFVFTDCTLEGLEMKFDNCVGCRVEGCTVPGVGGGITLTTNWNGNASNVIARNNLNLSNQFVAGWNDQARVATTDATVTVLKSVTVPASTTVGIRGYVVARRTGGVSGTAEDGALYRFEAVYKNVAGTATLIGSATITAIGESQAGWDVTLPVSSGNVNISVTGAASNNIRWYLTGFETFNVSA